MTNKISYKMAASLRVLPTKWLCGSFAHKMAAFLGVCLEDGGVSESLPAKWRRGKFAYKMAAMPRF